MSYSIGLPRTFLKQYEDMVPPWGPVGYVTYKRTYARMITDLGRTEEWHETCARVCNGLVEIGGLFKDSELTSLYDNMFHLKGLPSGRAIWQLGTDTVERLGADSLQNCWLVVCNDLESFCFAFDELMLGGGVGFNILPEYVYELPRVKYDPPVVRAETPDCDFIVPDNREGWIELLRRVLQAFFIDGKPLAFSTQCVRSAGKVIHSFGGIASGSEPLVKGIMQIVEILHKRVGEKLRPIDCMDIMNIIGTIVVSGNVRRSSQIAIGHHQDLDFIQAKNWNKHTVPNWRRMSNNTIACHRIQDLPEAYWEPYRANGECYGLLNLENCQRLGRLADGLDYRPDFRVVGCNPCVTGDTLVAVADGRGAIAINKLDGDTPVYCLSDSDEVTVRMMRNPRVTGHQQKVYKVTFDNNQSLRVTGNHKFLCSDGVMRRVDQLDIGTGLRIMTRYVPEDCDGNSRGDLYTYMSFGGYGRFYEHQEIARFHGEPDLTGKHVHHKDGDRLNNDLSNLSVRDATEHLSQHSKGGSNPNFSGFNNDEIIALGVAFCKKLGRRFSVKEWKRSSHPELNFQGSGYRSNIADGYFAFSMLCGNLAGVVSDGDPRTIRVYQDMLASGYEARIKDNTVDVVKKCEACGKSFWIHHRRRENACCGFSCANTLRDTSKARETNRKIIDSKQKVIRRQQLDVFTKLKMELGMKPQKKEWMQACRDQGVSPEVSRKSSPFASWKLLCAATETHNHRIVSITEDGYEDVWNGTVDDFHNFFLGCFDEGINDYGRHRWVMVNSKNCGESTLEDRESCNLAETLLPNISGLDEWIKILIPLYKATKTIANYHYLYPKTEEVVHRNYRVGVSLSGWMSAPWAHNKSIVDSAYRALEAADGVYSKQLGVPTSVKLTTVKPSGCRPASELTTTNRGILKLDELMEGHTGEWSKFQGDHEVLQGPESNRIIGTYDNGIQQVYAISLSYNTRLLSTADHPWFVKRHRKYNGMAGLKPVGRWVKTCHLQPEDILEFNQGSYTSMTASTFTSIDQDKLITKSDTKRIKQPKKMTTDLAWLLGFFQGDGCLSEGKYRVRFVKDHKDTLERVSSIIGEAFGVQAKILPASNREAFEIAFASKMLYHWFLANNLEKSGNVVRVVRESSVEHLLAYFAGLVDSDGCVYESTDYWTFCITQANEEFLREVQQVGLAIGLVMGLSHNTKGENFQSEKNMWVLTACARSTSESLERVLSHSVKAIGVTGPYTTDRPGKNSPHVGLVKGVTPHSMVSTYDIEVENEHWYYNGAFKSHNTVSLLPYGCTPGMHAAFSRYLIRRIRFAANDPLIEICRQHNYHIEPELNLDGSHNLDTMVVSFPMDYGPKAVTEDKVSVLDELEVQRFLQTYWSDQSVSCSHYFQRKEVDQIQEWLALNYASSVKTCSFMHAMDHGFRQAPLEKITPTQYMELMEVVKPITQITDDREIDMVDSLECQGGSCPVK